MLMNTIWSIAFDMAVYFDSISGSSIFSFRTSDLRMKNLLPSYYSIIFSAIPVILLLTNSGELSNRMELKYGDTFVFSV